MSGPAAARAAATGGGPLNSALGQWAVLGLGAYVVAGPEKAGEIFREGVRFAATLAGGGGPPGSARREQRPPPAPIVIHHAAPPAGTSSRFLGSLLRLMLGAGLCWGSYAFLTSVSWIPDSIKAALPVTRSLFDRAVTVLAQSVASVRDSLAAQISSLASSQDDLSAKQDDTHSEVLAARTDLHDLRFDVDDVQGSLGRCESSLGRADRRTSYAARGVGLLVRCLKAILPPGAEASSLAAELEEFERTGPEDGEYDAGKDVESGRGGAPSSGRDPNEEGTQRRSLPPQDRTGRADQDQSPVARPLPRPSRRLERMDSVPERTENERPEAYQSARRDAVDGMAGEVREFLCTPNRHSFKQ
uniref:Uncharacterized protein n=1 Tax=Odontella aurita TaxID=265563 RepID=A0A7S4N1D0_9STRA|mmetsp:Transcript_4300/g.11984  ORF Transcript_4300/g.11984 Transcript_4300/m.11984 type:complete len:359 (+) Transcript_4300:216-1292(+)